VKNKKREKRRKVKRLLARLSFKTGVLPGGAFGTDRQATGTGLKGYDAF